jgi:osmotically-inducible protein OsmY
VLVHDGGKVALEGFAHDWRERDEVDRAAWSVPGVISVEDNLTIA